MDHIFNNKCLSKISLVSAKMIPREPAKLIIFYHFKYYYPQIDIYKKRLSSFKETVNEIVYQIQWALYLKHFREGRSTDNLIVAIFLKTSKLSFI